VGGNAATEPHKTGCSGYPEEEFSGTHKLVHAIRKVVRAGKYVSPSLAEKLVYDLGSNTEKPVHEILSEDNSERAGFLRAESTLIF